KRAHNRRRTGPRCADLSAQKRAREIGGPKGESGAFGNNLSSRRTSSAPSRIIIISSPNPRPQWSSLQCRCEWLVPARVQTYLNANLATAKRRAFLIRRV